MKKGLSALFFALVTMTVLVSNVLAAPAQSARNATLKRVTYEKSGIVLVFQASGLSKNDLNRISFTAHSMQWNMVCHFVDGATQVRCIVSKKLSMFAGENFHGNLGGFDFSGKIPSMRVFSSPQVSKVSLLTAIPTACSEGQTLSYTFEYSNTSYQAEVWSDSYMSADAFHSLYGVYPEYMNTFIDHAQTYYIYGYTTYTAGHGSTPAGNWDALVSAYESDGYTIQKTGESCD